MRFRFVATVAACLGCGDGIGANPAIAVNAVSSPSEGSTNAFRPGAVIAIQVNAYHNLTTTRRCILRYSGTATINDRINYISGDGIFVDVGPNNRVVGTITYSVPAAGDYRFTVRMSSSGGVGPAIEGSYNMETIKFRN